MIIKFKTIHIGEGSGRGSGRVGSVFLSAIAGRVGSGQRFAGSGRVGSKKSDPWTLDNSGVYRRFSKGSSVVFDHLWTIPLLKSLRNNLLHQKLALARIISLDHLQLIHNFLVCPSVKRFEHSPLGSLHRLHWYLTGEVPDDSSRVIIIQEPFDDCGVNTHQN